MHFWDTVEENAEDFKDNVKNEDRSFNSPYDLYYLPFSASHLLLCVTLLLQYVLFLNQSNVVMLYPARGVGGAVTASCQGDNEWKEKRELQSEQRHKSKRPWSKTLPEGKSSSEESDCKSAV